ncbi:unnamed protein product [Strongylus vulgaris]|uniref:Uncharacterized protein n=1 Tax=Strongylus vulgaris TaxID=40348 RepID=A0A3P7JCF7_STRVU|nr:unnamed protein product [Strongylus vulgaris]
MAALYNVDPADDIDINIRADYSSQVVYILLTTENATVPNVIDQDGQKPKVETSGTYYKVVDLLLPYYYQMENMAALYDVDPADDIDINIRADYSSQVVYILITTENATVPNAIDQDGQKPKVETSGTYYKYKRVATVRAKNLLTLALNAPTLISRIVSTRNHSMREEFRSSGDYPVPVLKKGNCEFPKRQAILASFSNNAVDFEIRNNVQKSLTS